nr:MAG TPA: hypothetical protein [Caudoviricetes sp.]
MHEKNIGAEGNGFESGRFARVDRKSNFGDRFTVGSFVLNLNTVAGYIVREILFFQKRIKIRVEFEKRHILSSPCPGLSNPPKRFRNECVRQAHIRIARKSEKSRKQRIGLFNQAETGRPVLTDTVQSESAFHAAVRISDKIDGCSIRHTVACDKKFDAVSEFFFGYGAHGRKLADHAERVKIFLPQKIIPPKEIRHRHRKFPKKTQIRRRIEPAPVGSVKIASHNRIAFGGKQYHVRTIRSRVRPFIASDDYDGRRFFFALPFVYVKDCGTPVEISGFGKSRSERAGKSYFRFRNAQTIRIDRDGRKADGNACKRNRCDQNQHRKNDKNGTVMIDIEFRHKTGKCTNIRKKRDKRKHKKRSRNEIDIPCQDLQNDDDESRRHKNGGSIEAFVFKEENPRARSGKQKRRKQIAENGIHHVVIIAEKDKMRNKIERRASA